MISRAVLTFLVWPVMVLSACSLNHGAPDQGVDSDNSDNTISGVVAAGAPVRGTVILKNANSANTYLSGVIEPDGHFSIHLVDTMTGPYILQARGTVGGRSVCLHSLGTRSDVSDIVNITPLTDLIVGHLTEQAPELYFDSFVDPPLSRIATDDILDRYESLIRSRFWDLIDSAGVDAAGINLFNTPFAADHTGLDAVLDMIRVIPQWTPEGERLDTVSLRNILTGEELIENLADTTESDGFSAVDRNLVDAFVQAMTDIDGMFADWALRFETACPDPTAAGLVALFDEGFLYNGYDRRAFLESICGNPDLIGMTVSGLSLDAMDLDNGTAVVSLTVSTADGHSQSLQNWTLTRTAGQWLIAGNQQLIDVQVGACAAYSQTSREILANGIGLYAVAPAADRVADVDHITVTGPGIPSGDPVILTRQGGDPAVFARSGSRPLGFHQPTDDLGTPDPLTVTENSRYTFVLCDNGGNAVNPGGYVRVLPKGYGDTGVLTSRISRHAVSFTRPYPQLLSAFTGDGLLVCEWALPVRGTARTLFFMGTRPSGRFLLSENLAPLATTCTRVIDQDGIDTFDIYLRTVDEFGRIMDTVISKTTQPPHIVMPDSVIGVSPRLF
ncbi:hypothetical protein JCM14469_04290 [Desulfatiferula olefinivorans]